VGLGRRLGHPCVSPRVKRSSRRMHVLVAPQRLLLR
jgi:hypothetical protein